MPRFLLVLSAFLVLSCGTSRPPQATAPPVAHADDDGDGHLHEHQTQETVTSMSGSHEHLGPHFNWTGLRRSNPADQEKAAAIVRELRRTLAQYRDYRVAIKDGFEPFLPNVQQEHYHFTSKWRGFKAAFASTLRSQPRSSIARQQMAMSWKAPCTRHRSERMKRT
jgi:diadenosine tetraphosphate (Ap4A) HIT family hydrolase